ncbi:MAG: ABC transporter ATP-binding protein [Candidatus Moranbacteria bacterium]|nr:ABC transporter ATP-binding protein [Candidatus Moranbacteria bacterium]
MAFIECRDLIKSYENDGVETSVLKGISFSLERGEFVSIMGPSGSGKSTFMHILGLLDVPSGGDYYFLDKNTKDLSENDLAYLRNQNIGFIFQSFNLLARTSVFENVELPLLYDIYKKSQSCEEDLSFLSRVKNSISGASRKCHEKSIRDALVSVGMEHRIMYKSSQLSGGEKQRVAIARALVNNPDIIFADEPTGNLDSKSGLQVMQILQDLNERGKTIVLVTHETYTAEHAKRIIRIRDGEIESDEAMREWRDARKEKNLK